MIGDGRLVRAKRPSVAADPFPPPPASLVRPLDDLDSAWRVGGEGARLKAVRAAAERLREPFVSGPRVVSVRTLPLTTLPYPAKYAFWGAAHTLGPFVIMTHRALLVQFFQEGALKNLLDFASRPPEQNPFKGRVTAQLGATNGLGGTLQAQAMLRHVLSGLGCHTLPGAFTVSKVAEALENTHRLDEAFLRSLVVRSRAGLDLLGASPRLSPGVIDAAKLRTLVDFVSRYYHAVVLDVPPESQVHRPVVRKALDLSDVVLDPNVSIAYLDDACRGRFASRCACAML